MGKGTSTQYLSLEERKLRNWWKREQAQALLESREPNYNRAYRNELIEMEDIPEYLHFSIAPRPFPYTFRHHKFRYIEGSKEEEVQYTDRGGNTVKRGKTQWPRNMKSHRK